MEGDRSSPDPGRDRVRGSYWVLFDFVSEGRAGKHDMGNDEYFPRFIIAQPWLLIRVLCLGYSFAIG
jgi:hypothetical protein